MAPCVKQLAMGGTQMALQRPSGYKGSSISKGRGQVLADAVTGPNCHHGVSRRSKSREFWVPKEGPSSPPAGWEQHEGWEQLRNGRLSVPWDHRKGMLLVLEDTLLQGFYKGIKFSDILLMHSQLLW